MDLGNGRGAQWLFTDVGKFLGNGAFQFRLDGGEHLGKRHGHTVGPELFQLPAIRLGHHVRTHGHDLAEFDIRRTQVLQNFAQLDRRKAGSDAVLPEDHENF